MDNHPDEEMEMPSNGHTINKDAPGFTDSTRDASGQDVQATTSEEWQPSGHEKAIMYTLSALNLIVSLDATVIVTSLAAIIGDIGGSTTEAFWIGTSYLLVNAVSMPVICSISDVIGRPICLIFSIAAFTVGTIICCTAQSITALLVGRSIQGIGGGGIHSLSLVIQTDFVPLRWRPKWYGVTLAAWALGLSSGPIIGGAIAERTTWRWIFYLMFPILGFGLATVPYLLTLRPKKATAQEKFSRIDWIGMFIFTGSSTSFLIAISWGGTQLYGTLYYVPLYFLSVKDYSPINTGVALLPNLLTFAVSGIVTGRLVTRFNNFRVAIWIGWFLASVAAALFTVWRVNDSKPVWVAMCNPGDEGAAAAMYIFVRQFGIAVGVGVGATTFQNALKLKLGWAGLPTSIADEAESYLPILHSLPDGPQKDAIYDAYKFGLQIVFATWLAISVVVLFFTLLFIRHADMNRKLASEHHLDSERMNRHWGEKKATVKTTQ
ncbi:hypothetical protein ONZ43_g1105 [Nemania bipapillata]|uniref:Uncharacterized protein n=1 Tax=Nemania bipapillata TaxID=110536 RepID=A0ACC2J5S0_9PEZI|nr:hypothetical protein ONZ43_g1105 [Nemania bipapillata]